MAEHTPEPWMVDQSYDWPSKVRSCVKGHSDRWVFDASYKPDNPQETLANARRIVACVNACAGLPIEFLEANGVAKLVELTKASNGALNAAAWAATSAAASAATRDVAWYDEEEWQFDRLCQWLGDDEPEVWMLPVKAKVVQHERAQQIIAEAEAKHAPQWDSLIARFHAAKHPDAILARRRRERMEREHQEELSRG